MKQGTGLLVWMALTGLTALIADPARGAERTAVVLSTAAVGGETVSCGCQKKDLGGIARRATAIAAERAKAEATLLVDAGDFGSQVDFEPWTRTAFQWRMMQELGYDAVTPGPNEMTEGLPSLLDLLATAPGIRVVSANITDKSGARIWPEHALIEKGGVVFGVTGVTSRAYYSFNLTRKKQKSDDFDFIDIREALGRVVPELQEKADVVVVLLHASASEARRIVADVPGMDVVVVGHAPGFAFAPEKVEKSLVVRGGGQGQYLSVLELTLDGEGRITGHHGEGLPLGDSVAKDEALDAVVTAFDKKYDARKPKEAEAAAAKSE